MQARQGDIFFESVDSPIKNERKMDSQVIAYGEVTGHSHQIMSPKISEMDSSVDEKGDIFVRSPHCPIIIGHDEHSTIELPQNTWIRISRQREYDPAAAERERRVAD